MSSTTAPYSSPTMAILASSTSPLPASSIKSTTPRRSFWTWQSKEHSMLGQPCGADIIHLPPYVLAFRDPEAWANIYRAYKSKNGGAVRDRRKDQVRHQRIGEKPPWWRALIGQKALETAKCKLQSSNGGRIEQIEKIKRKEKSEKQKNKKQKREKKELCFL
ncbi:hypothetical protein PS2_012387 [Malus domestica]